MTGEVAQTPGAMMRVDPIFPIDPADQQLQFTLMAADGQTGKAAAPAATPQAARPGRAPRLRAVASAVSDPQAAGRPPGLGVAPGPTPGDSVTQDMVVRELAGIAFFDIRKLFNDDGSLKRVQDLDGATAAAIASIEVVEIGPGGQLELGKKFKSPEKLKALDLLGTHLGMFAKKADDAPDPLRKALAQMPADRAEGMLAALELVKSIKGKSHGAT